MIAGILGTFPIAYQAYQALRIKVVSIDVLVTIAAIGAFMIQNYEEAAIVTFLFLLGSYLEQRTLNQTRSAIRELTEMAPETAWLKTKEGFVEVSIEEVEVGNLLMVKTGARVPVDGKVVSGQASINEASITGESIPLAKEVGSEVYAGTIVENGTIQIETSKVGEETTFGKIISLVEEAQDSKSEAERFIDQFSNYYTPFVLLLAFIVYIFTREVELAITILVLGCPGALVIGAPVSNVAGIGNGAKHGILLKGSEVIHEFSKVDTFIFDKTGTLTIGKPSVARIKTYGSKTDQALCYLATIEAESDHPLAKAIIDQVGKTLDVKVEKTEVIKGGGIKAEIEDQQIIIGNLSLMREEGIPIGMEVHQDIQAFEENGYSLVMTAVEGELKVLMGIQDQVRPGIKEDLNSLKQLGIKELMMLSGDNQKTVDLVAQEVGIDKAYGHLLPEDKASMIEQLQAEGKRVAFVGDGVNDSPSIALATIGIAMGNGTEVAIESSDVVIMNSDFHRLPHALGLAKAAVTNMKQNIMIAVGVVLFLLMSLLMSDWMNMSLGMLLHEGSILVVIFNAMRLLSYRLKNVWQLDLDQG